MENRERQLKFLDMELCAETEEFERKFSARARYLLDESEELFIGQFLKFDKGEMIVKFRTSRSFPRKGEYVQAMYLPAAMQDYKKWGDWTYEHLFKNRLKSTEAVCIWQSKSKDDGFALLGFRGVDLDFSKYIGETHGALLVFGPNRPPIDYLANLYKLTQNTYSPAVKDILDYDYAVTDASPILITGTKPSDYIHRQIDVSPITILQGPPGTGKTRLISDLCASLCSENKSVLVTALTNRALMEISEKDSLKGMLAEGKILKSNLTVDEQEEQPQLQPIKQIVPLDGCLVMATYYITSGLAVDLTEDGAFDVVIMDEASQALLAMFAVANKIGKVNLWVGDTAQLSPVIALNDDRVRKNNFHDFVDGLRTLTTKRIFPLYQLTNTYRLSQRAANYTGIFYNDTLKSASSTTPIKLQNLENILNANGGPSLVLTDMEIGDATPKYAMDMATYLVYSILEEKSDAEVAVLTCLRKTTRALQKSIALRLGLGNKVLIDTIARVQGLTTEITLLFIPNTSLVRSLEPCLFNVATSRAKGHTIIVADKDIIKFASMESRVRKFLERLYDDQMLYVPVHRIKDFIDYKD